MKLKGATGDHKSFEQNGLPNIFIGQDNLKPYIHNPDTLDYDEIDRVAVEVVITVTFCIEIE